MNLKQKMSDKVAVGLAKRFYSNIKRNCRNRGDVEGMKLIDQLFVAIDKKDVEEVEELQTIIAGHLQMKRQERGVLGFGKKK